jgi:hypothetical protein
MGGELGQLIGQGASRHDDPRALACQRLRDGQADAPARARDDRDLAR